MNSSAARAAQLYTAAREYVAVAGLEHEIRWQRDLKLEEFTETDLLREGAWVILCSGFREASVRGVFNYLSLCFFDFEDASKIASAGATCTNAARVGFKNLLKLRAIVRMAEQIVTIGFDRFKERVLSDPVSELQVIPFIGPITAVHLAKNLGLDSAKPDRHLLRASLALGYSSPLALCDSLSQMFNEQVNVVDLILWRYLADNPNKRATWGDSKSFR